MREDITHHSVSEARPLHMFMSVPLGWVDASDAGWTYLGLSEIRCFHTGQKLTPRAGLRPGGPLDLCRVPDTAGSPQTRLVCAASRVSSDRSWSRTDFRFLIDSHAIPLTASVLK